MIYLGRALSHVWLHIMWFVRHLLYIITFVYLYKLHCTLQFCANLLYLMFAFPYRHWVCINALMGNNTENIETILPSLQTVCKCLFTLHCSKILDKVNVGKHWRDTKHCFKYFTAHKTFWTMSLAFLNGCSVLCICLNGTSITASK